MVKRDEAPERAASTPVSGQPPAATPSSDVALICGATPDGQGVHVVRCRDGVLSAGAVRPLVEGQAIQGEVVRLKPRPELPRVCDVEVEYTPPNAPHAARKGPVQVASDVYRKNWDVIFKRKPELTN